MGRDKTVLFLVVMYAGAFLAGFSENLMNMALMSIMADFSVDSITAQWLVTGYMIVATIFVICTAFFFRRIKLRILFFIAAAAVIIGSAIGFVSTSFEMLMVGRLIQAIGFGPLIPMMMNSVLVVVAKRKLGAYMAIGGCMISFGPAFAPAVCGALVTALGWHAVFLAPLVGMAVVTVLGIFFVKSFDTVSAKLDLLSVVLCSLFLLALCFGLSQLTVSLSFGIGCLVSALVIGALFVIRQNKASHPLISMEPMKRKSFWPAALLVTIAMLSSFALSVLLPLYYEGALGMTAVSAGFLILIPVAINCVVALVAGRIMDRAGEWPLLPIGYGLAAIGFILLALFASSMNAKLVVVASVVAFVGIGLVFSPSQTAGLRTLPCEENPFGVAIMTTATQLAACVAPSLYIGVMSGAQVSALAGGSAAEPATALGFATAIVVAAVIGVIAFATAFAFARAQVRRDEERAGDPVKIA